MKLRLFQLLSLAALVVGFGSVHAAEEPFSKRVGDVKVADVQAGPAYDLPFLTWGGDVATFIANGGDKATKDGTLFAKQGLKFNLVNGDDFIGQVKKYLEGKTPYIRGTMSQLGQASEVLGKDPRTKPVVFLQLTWSQGDHMVARDTVKTLNDLKGKKVALQWGGPHVGMFDDVLRSAGLKWSDVTVVWTTDVTGPKGPAEAIRKDKTVDACFVITPDMLELTGGGLDKTGTGAEKSIKGGRVIISTANLTHSIADVYAVRKDFYDKNKETIEKLAAAYLKACEELVPMRKNKDDKDKDKALAEKYKAVLKMTQDILGKDAIPDADAAHGLISDANFVALPGNAAFFKDPKEKNPVNFENRAKAAVDMAVSQGYAGSRVELTAADLDYEKLKKLTELGLAIERPKESHDIFKGVEVNPSDIDKDTALSFSVLFDPDAANFDMKKYEADFKKVIDQSALFGGALFVVRGHVDPTRTIRLFVTAGLAKGLITREQIPGGGYKYYTKKDGKEFNLSDTKKVIEMIEKEDYSGVDESPKVTLDAAKKLSVERAKTVLEAMIEQGRRQGVNLVPTQFRSDGVGITEPIIAVPKDNDQAAKNRRVEFRVLRVSPEKLSSKDFDN
jgi:ABC-type nitrate/sulfonate/bicarbonate transport system substrate-binding protein